MNSDLVRHRASGREAQLADMHRQLAAAVDSLVTGEDWKAALSFAARFRARSFNNTLLIHAQHAAAHSSGLVDTPLPTYVAGFKQWKALGRTVEKGQSGYRIIAPITARFASATPQVENSWRRITRTERPSPGETVRTRMVGVRPAHVFDVAQTSGEPIPEPPRPTVLTGRAPAGLWDGLADRIVAEGFELRLVSTAAAIGGANGLTDFLTREVSVRMDMDDAAQAKTLAHELGHVLLHDPDRTLGSGAWAHAASDAGLHRGIAEVEAESVALMIGAAHGLDTTAYTVPYVGTWAANVDGAQPGEVVQRTAERVRRTATDILDRLDTPQLANGEPPGLDRTAQRRPPSPEAAPAAATQAARPTGLSR